MITIWSWELFYINKTNKQTNLAETKIGTMVMTPATLKYNFAENVCG
jgi:hypothetical protein